MGILPAGFACMCKTEEAGCYKLQRETWHGRPVGARGQYQGWVGAQSSWQPVEGGTREGRCPPQPPGPGVDQVKTIPKGWSCGVSPWLGGSCGEQLGRWQTLFLRLDPVTQHKVRQQPQGQEEDTQDQEVHVEFGVFHVQLLEDALWLPEGTVLL